MMRDKRKNEHYFKEYIEYQYDRVNKKEEKFLSCGSDLAKKERVALSLSKMELDLLIAEFSSGSDKRHLQLLLDKACLVFSEMQQIDYESLMNLLSLSIILEHNSQVKKVIEKHEDMIENDKLLKCLVGYILDKKVVWHGRFLIHDIYEELELLDTANDKEEILNNYLNSWYNNRKDCSWYDTDKSKNDVYVGYWSFEVAALSKIFSIDDAILKQNEFYPCI